ncbi:adenylate/guanylate cyclase domain-containing protein [Candidatus Riflebacteria bacterium]
MLTVENELIDKFTETLYRIMKGESPGQIKLPEDYPDNEIKQFAGYLNKFLDQYHEFTDFMSKFANGDLNQNIRGKMKIVQFSKTLQANLKHLTYKTQRISEGDFSQKVDFIGDFSEAFNKMCAQLKDAFEKIEAQNEELTRANQIISQEKEKSEKLLLNILPKKVVRQLKDTGKSEPQTFEDVTVYFSDIVGFTDKSTTIKPKVLISELNEMFTVFDRIMENNNCERIKTIGDAYLAVCGMPQSDPDHARNIVNSALQIRDNMVNRKDSSINWEIRIGIHTGRVVGGVVGIKKYIYDVFGDTINTAARMESHSEPMKINVSETTYKLLKNDYEFFERDPLEIKGKGLMKMYYVNKQLSTTSKKPSRRSSPRIEVNTKINILFDSFSFNGEVDNLAVDGGVLIRVLKNDVDRVDKINTPKKVTLQLKPENESTSYQAEIVRYYEDDTHNFFCIKF